mmetsp:Transcript_101908/g.199872  ORF Transcript_101908/g.199872 Transcript_101908/m.199872 type:complete len:80 (+) Transcript_101908:893-1132(+)
MGNAASLGVQLQVQEKKKKKKEKQKWRALKKQRNAGNTAALCLSEWVLIASLLSQVSLNAAPVALNFINKILQGITNLF